MDAEAVVGDYDGSSEPDRSPTRTRGSDVLMGQM